MQSHWFWWTVFTNKFMYNKHKIISFLLFEFTFDGGTVYVS